MPFARSFHRSSSVAAGMCSSLHRSPDGRCYVGEPAYIASKWGQVGYAHALREELLEHGIRVSLVEPGLVDTPLARGNPKVQELLSAIQPLDPDDVARAIVYAWRQPENVVVSEVALRPLLQRPF